MGVGEELIDQYDEAGRVVGTVTRARMRAEGLWHAATLVLVRSGDGNSVYVHRRHPDKDVFPGLHDCWAGGVVGAGESPQTCAERELAEELGIGGVAMRPLFGFRFTQPPVRYHAFAYEVSWDGPISHQPEEVVAGWWLPLTELRTKLADPACPFVPDGRAAIELWFDRYGEESAGKPGAAPKAR